MGQHSLLLFGMPAETRTNCACLSWMLASQARVARNPILGSCVETAWPGVGPCPAVSRAHEKKQIPCILLPQGSYPIAWVLSRLWVDTQLV